MGFYVRFMMYYVSGLCPDIGTVHGRCDLQRTREGRREGYFLSELRLACHFVLHVVYIAFC